MKRGLWFIILLFTLFTLEAETISVLYFENTTKNEEFAWLSKGIADMLITDIAPYIDVVERENLQKVLQEQKLALSGLVAEDNAVELGQLLNARKIVYGSFIIADTAVRIDGKVTDTETGRIIATFSDTGLVRDILLIQNRLAGRLSAALGVKAADNDPSSYTFEAVKSYYEGVDLLDRGIAKDALEKFQEASALDPSYLKPYKGIEDSYRFLKDFKRMRYQREILDLHEKAAKIQKRLNEKPFKTFAEICMTPEYAELSARDSDAAFNEYFAYFQGDTRAQVVWNLQNILIELADKYEEYFSDTEKERALYEEVIQIAGASETQLAGDKFLPEILYQRLLAFVYIQAWDRVKEQCEELMLDYPDYRMMWAVEDFYEDALEKGGS